MSSVVSSKSDVTLEGDLGEGRGSKDQRLSSLADSEDGTPQELRKEQSVSSSTLINDHPEERGATPSRQIGEAGHQMSVLFRQELLNLCQAKTDSRIGVEVAKLSDPDLDLVQLLGRCLPHIVPNVSLAKREVCECECVPVWVCAYVSGCVVVCE